MGAAARGVRAPSPPVPSMPPLSLRDRLTHIKTELDFDLDETLSVGAQLKSALTYVGLNGENQTIAWRMAALEARVFSKTDIEMDDTYDDGATAATNRSTAHSLHQRVKRMGDELMVDLDGALPLGKHLSKLAHTLNTDVHNHTLLDKLAIMERAIGLSVSSMR
uniref:Uncharacterized protein n=1 Tax=Prymnesium polylepis TaxID=72548 RepID=A0A7S4I9R1_9EUKA|mmetsp:Transcript_28598/g.70391  ORF Transcript_28598/g.70391 Transcript_28598/m.70391 type:complete len:164 (+) Transcript_28598:2-493(+)